MRSNVSYAPGAQAEHPRYSLAYLARPEDKTMKGLGKSGEMPRFAEGLVEQEPEPEGEEAVTIGEWIIRRSEALKTETYKKELWALTRGTEDRSLRRGEGTHAQ